MNRGYILDVDPSNQFWLHNGQSVKNLVELIEVLRTIDDEVFSFHVNDEKNDFASWVKGVIDQEFGEELSKLTDRSSMVKAIENRLKKPELPSEPEEPHKLEPQEPLKPAVTPMDVPKPSAIETQLDEILNKEKEIESRERIIQDIEARIEKKLQSTIPKRFFSKEFIEGLLIGILILLVSGLVYIKFFMPY